MVAKYRTGTRKDIMSKKPIVRRVELFCSCNECGNIFQEIVEKKHTYIYYIVCFNCGSTCRAEDFEQFHLDRFKMKK